MTLIVKKHLQIAKGMSPRHRHTEQIDIRTVKGMNHRRTDRSIAIRTHSRKPNRTFTGD